MPVSLDTLNAFIYATVLEGAIRSQVDDGAVTTYTAGQSFSELPCHVRKPIRRTSKTAALLDSISPHGRY